MSGEVEERRVTSSLPRPFSLPLCAGGHRYPSFCPSIDNTGISDGEMYGFDIREEEEEEEEEEEDNTE